MRHLDGRTEQDERLERGGSVEPNALRDPGIPFRYHYCSIEPPLAHWNGLLAGDYPSASLVSCALIVTCAQAAYSHPVVVLLFPFGIAPAPRVQYSY